MADCIHCGQKAGFLRNTHRECDEAYRANLAKDEQARHGLMADARTAVLSPVDGQGPLDHLKAALRESAISPAQQRELLAEAWESTVDQVLEDGITRDTQTAKPESFHTTEGWFVYNLVTNLAQLQ